MVALTPEVTWAQRSDESEASKNYVFLTIVVADVAKENLSVNLTPTKLSYKAKTAKGAEYAVEIDFFEEVDPAESKQAHSGRATEFVLRKKVAKQEFWPRLTKEKVKLHWLKTDFDKWVDEDEQDGPAPEPEFDPSMMQGMGGGGGGDDGGFGGIDFSKLGGGMGGMPDMASLAGMGGMGGMGGMPGMPGMGGMGTGLDDDSDDDQDMPDLEEPGKKTTPADAAGTASTEKGKGKIEELD